MLMKTKMGGRANYIREIFIIFCLQVSIALCFNLSILHTNDIHGRFEEGDKHGFTCDPNKDTCFGGIARIATVVKEVRNKEENVVLVDGADRFTGTIWSEIYKGNASRVFFNELNYTAITLGNHDFDYGVKTLLGFLEEIKCPVVVSNMNTTKEPLWPDDTQLVRTTVIVNVNGERIGFVGYILLETSRTSNPGENIEFLSIINSVQNAVKELESKGINKIIAVGHAGFDVDKEIAKKVVGVDVVVGGHSNTFLYSGNPPSDDTPKGPYPYIVHPNHNMYLSVPVVQAYYYTKYLGKLQVTFNDMGEVTGWSGNPVLLDSTVAKDPHIYGIVKKMKVLVDKRGNEKIGQAKVQLTAMNCGTGPCLLGELITSAMVYHFRSYNASISLFHGSYIRTLPTDGQGNILYKDLFISFPYRNTIDMVELSGADLKSSLEVTGFLQMQGLRVKYSIGKPRRVEDLQVKQVQCPTSNCYTPINMSKIYRVVSDSYFITTSNRVIAAKGRNRIRGNSIYDVLLEYFKAKYPVRNDVSIAGKLRHSFVVFLSVMFAKIIIFWD